MFENYEIGKKEFKNENTGIKSNYQNLERFLKISKISSSHSSDRINL